MRAIRRAKGEASESDSIKEQLFETDCDYFDSDEEPEEEEQSNEANSDKAIRDKDQSEDENDE